MGFDEIKRDRWTNKWTVKLKALHSNEKITVELKNTKSKLKKNLNFTAKNAFS